MCWLLQSWSMLGIRQGTKSGRNTTKGETEDLLEKDKGHKTYVQDDQLVVK